MTAKNNDKTSVRTNEENILWFSSSENSNFADIIPMCKLVDNLEAKEPKMFPLIPIAPGIITNSPGNVSRKNVILPRIIPAHKSPTAHIKSAIRLSLMMERCSSTKSGNVEITDSGLRIFFCLSFTHITTHNHFITLSLRLLILLEYLQVNRFLRPIFQVNRLLHLFLLKLRYLPVKALCVYPVHISMMYLF